MTCEEARLLSAFARPEGRDLDPSERQLLDAHLATCAACAAAAQREREFDERVGQAMRNVAIPIGLQGQLLTRLSNEQNAVRLRRVGRYLAAVAAMTLLAILVGSWWQMNHRPPLVDLYELANNSGLKKEASAVQASLKDKAKRPDLEFPRDLATKWDFALLTAHYVENVGGQEVPTLIFNKGTASAKVTLWRKGQYVATQFNKSYADGPRLLGDPDNDLYVALVVIEGGKYSDFVKPGTPPTT